MSRDPILSIEDLTIAFPQRKGPLRSVVDSISLSVRQGETLGLVGESGSGKTMAALSIMGLIPKPGRAVSGRILLNGQNLLTKTEEELRAVRGSEASIVFQDPLSSLNPVKPIGSLLVQSALLHRKCGKKEAWDRSVDIIGTVGIPNPAERMRSYPHEFSGGQRQRIMIALAAINNPSLIIADEPTTALDATVQIQILELLKSMTIESSLFLITHDLSVTAGICDMIAVMREGRIIEAGTAEEILTNPQKSYTKALLAAVPRFGERRLTNSGTVHEPAERPLLEVRDLTVSYDLAGRSFKAVDRVALRIAPNETLGIVGESGSGKSTIAKAVLQMVRPSNGQITFEGQNIFPIEGRDMRDVKRRMQYVFQDPYSSLDPRWTVGRIIAEPLRVHALGSLEEIEERVSELIDQVGLPSDAVDRYPAEFSGGQRQRIALARALGVRPNLLIADEPVSSLDVTIQWKIAKLLKALQTEYKLALIFIAHDLPLVYQLTDRIVVLYLGQVVEEGPTDKVLSSPQHPFTAALLSASAAGSLGADPSDLHAKGEPASPLDPPTGCHYHPRCPIARPECTKTAPLLSRHDQDVAVACHFPGECAGQFSS